MTDPLVELERRRDHALRDLVDLERQVEAGELTADVAADLQQRYEAEAATAIAAITARGSVIDDGRDASGDVSPTGVRPRRPTGRQVLYGVGLAVAVAVVVLVPRYTMDRPPAGLVTGNEATQRPEPASSGTSSTPRDLGSVTDAEMEKVIAANPDVVGMRLALAGRYANEGRYDLAVVHYTTVLEKDPGNAEAQAHLGWISLKVDRPQAAARLVDNALRSDPSLLDALWFQANVRLYGLRDPRGAVATLDKMRARGDLTPQVRRQVDELRAIATDRLAGQR